MRFLHFIFPYVKNKYIASTVIFLVWLIFFDSSNLATQYKLYRDFQNVNLQKEFYNVEIAKNKKDLEELMTNLTNLEQYGREKYLMKKDDEDIYIIVKKPAKDLKSKD